MEYISPGSVSFGPDLSLMGFHDGFGNGEAEAVAGGLFSGTVSPVETVEKVGDFFSSKRCSFICYGEMDHLFASQFFLLQIHCGGGFFETVFQRIVDQDFRKPAESSTVAGDHKVRLGISCKDLPPFKEDGFPGDEGIIHKFAEGKLRKL